MPKVKVTVQDGQTEQVMGFDTERVLRNLNVLRADLTAEEMEQFRSEWEKVREKTQDGKYILILPKDIIWEKVSIDVDDPRYFDIDSLNFAAVRVALSDILQENAGASKYMADRLANLVEPILRALIDTPAYKASQAAEEATEDE